MKRRVIVFTFLLVLFIFAPIGFAMYTRPEEMLKFAPGVAFALWVLAIVIGSTFYQLKKAELEISAVDYPMTFRQTWEFFGGLKHFFVTMMLALSPIVVMILYAIFT